MYWSVVKISHVMEWNFYINRLHGLKIKTNAILAKCVVGCNYNEQILLFFTSKALTLNPKQPLVQKHKAYYPRIGLKNEH
jgi:hypothetical protein